MLRNVHIAAASVVRHKVITASKRPVTWFTFCYGDRSSLTDAWPELKKLAMHSVGEQVTHLSAVIPVPIALHCADGKLLIFFSEDWNVRCDIVGSWRPLSSERTNIYPVLYRREAIGSCLDLIGLGKEIVHYSYLLTSLCYNENHY